MWSRIASFVQFPRQRNLIRATSPLMGWTAEGKSCKTTQNSHNYSTEVDVSFQEAFKLHNLEGDGPNMSTKIKKEDALKYYSKMQTIRRLEAASNSMYKDKIIRGFCHLYTGQEACAVAMRKQDTLITAYRCHGWCYLMGVSLFAILAELAGRKGGCSRGKGGSMHMYGTNFYGGNGIVGAQIPMGAGIGFAAKYKGTDSISFTLYGDGAANQGQLFEAFNIACLHKYPVVFVCENNHYGMGTGTKRSACCDQYYTRGDYVPGIWVDGMNVLAVRSATEYVMEYALKEGPIVMELNTYRYFGHSMSDPGTSYRSREEIQDVRQKRDPITTFKDFAISKGLMTEEEVKAIDATVKKEVDDAATKAKADTEIEMKEIFSDIYANNLEPKIRDNVGYTGEHLQINKDQKK